MILAATALGTLALGASEGVSVDIPYVSIAAELALTSQIESEITISGIGVPIGVVQFPAQVDSAQNYFLVSNNARATLAAAIDTDDLSVTLTGDLSKFKTSGALTLDLASTALRTASSSEVVYYSGKSGQVLTLTARGQDGTTAKAWPQGSAIEARIIERHHEIHTEALIAVETEVLANKAQVQTDIAGIEASLDGKLSLTGGTMTGPLTLASPPSAPLQAATKAYVDASSGVTGFVRYMAREYDARDYLNGDGVTDDTFLLQALLNQIDTDSENATIYFDNATYLIAGALQDTGRRNAQLLLPTIGITEQQYTVTFMGHSVPACSPSGYEPIVLPRGTRIKSTLASGSGTDPSVICGRGPVGGYLDETNYLHAEFENIVFQTVANPSYSCVNMRRMTSVSFTNCIIAAGQYMDVVRATRPTVAGSYGLILPQYNSGICQRLDGQVNVFGFYVGVRCGELMHAQNLGVWWCQHGLEFPFSYHASVIDRLLVFWCPYGAVWNAVHPVEIHQWDNEHTMTGETAWYATLTDIHDPNNYADGDIKWLTVRASFGRESIFIVNGGTGLQIRELGT